MQSTSVPDVAFRKALIQCDEFEETFHTEFEKKLFSINEELLATSKKIGLNDKIILFPTNEYLKVLKEKATKIVEEYWSKVQNEFIKTYIKRTTKSDLALSKAAKDRLYLGISKITQNEWEFYKKLSKLSVHKKKYKNSFRKKTIFSHAAKSNLKYKKVRYKKDAKHSVSYYKNTNANNTLKHAKETASDLYSDDANKIKKPIHRLLKKDHKKSAKKTVIKIPISNSHSSHSTTSFKNKRSVASKEKIDSNIKLCDNEVDIEMICNNLVDAVSKARRLKESITGISNATLENKPALGIFGNKPIPFIPCSSTTKSFNVGMKLQQFISLKKYSKSASSKEKSRSIYSGSRKTNTGRTQENEVDIKNVKNDVLELECEILKTRSINSQYIVTTYPWSPRGKETTNSESNHNNINDKNINQNKLLDHEINCLEHKDTCISSHCTSGDRKYRSRYTKTMPKDIVGYHHKCTRQYANGEESNVKSESKTTYASGPNFTLSECHKTDFYGSKKQAICNKASGDNSFDSNCNKLKEEWSKIFSMLSNLYRFAIKLTILIP